MQTLTDEAARQSTPRSSRLRIASGWAFVAAAIGATTALTLTTQTGASVQTDDRSIEVVEDSWAARYSTCIQNAVGTPDALERWVETCRQRATVHGDIDPAFVTCVRTDAGTADALDRWFVNCSTHRASLHDAQQ